MSEPVPLFCPNAACPARGQTHQGNIRVHSRKEPRYRCTVCRKTFVATKGTAFYRLHHRVDLFVQVVTLLAYGCPPAAVVAAFGLDERTVAAWLQRAGQHCQRVQQTLVEHPHMLTHVQADELRIKQQGAVIWGAMALAVQSRLWLGVVLRPSRDGALAIALAHLVRRCVQPGRLVWSVDGWKPYVRAILQVFREPVCIRTRGRPRLRHWAGLAIAQVVKHTTKKCHLLGITRQVIYGDTEQVANAFGSGVINTAWIERLNATFRTRVAALIRRGRSLARQAVTLSAAIYLTGTVYNFSASHGTLSWQDRRPTTPAMAAGLTDHRWPVEELLRYRAPLPHWKPPVHRGRRSKNEQALIARWCA